MSYGMMVGWPSPAIPQLQSENPAVGREPMTDETASWLSGTMCLTAAFITLGIGGLADRYGRKVIGCLAALPCCIAWLLIIFATEQTHLLVGAFLLGHGCRDGSVRGADLRVGDLLRRYTRHARQPAGADIERRHLVRLYSRRALLVPRGRDRCVHLAVALYLAFFLFVPESPVYLIRRNRLDEAAR